MIPAALEYRAAGDLGEALDLHCCCGGCRDRYLAGPAAHQLTALA